MIIVANIAYPTGQGVEFYGFEVIRYYLMKFLLYYESYPWTIRILYGLIIACIFTMMILFVLFLRKIHQTRRATKEYLSARKKLYKGFYSILVSVDKPDGRALETACGVPLSEILAYKPQTLSRLISELCMELSRELGNIPNADALCSLTGVKAYYERNLTTSKKVLHTLQNLADMHIPVSEGLLAIYLNHYDLSIRHMARMCHIVSSSADPYHYLQEELNDRLGLWYKMMLHRMFAWARSNERQMPQFLVLAKELHNEESAAFLIQETAYWGTNGEKAALHELFLSSNMEYRKAALHAVAILRDASQEQAAIDSYEHQPEPIRQEVIKTVYAINSGKHTEFFVEAFRKSTSKLTREVALTSLYTYGRDGRRTFELLREKYIKSNTDRTLMDQIDSLNVLNQMRSL
jgi:hypothetical protein